MYYSFMMKINYFFTKWKRTKEMYSRKRGLGTDLDNSVNSFGKSCLHQEQTLTYKEDKERKMGGGQGADGKEERKKEKGRETIRRGGRKKRPGGGGMMKKKGKRKRDGYEEERQRKSNS